MAISEFRYNKRRKHYSYIFGQKGDNRKNILLTSKPVHKKKQKDGTYREYKNVKLYQHPNPNKKGITQYVIPKVETDHHEVFDKKLNNWKFHPFDKRNIKKIKKGKYK